MKNWTIEHLVCRPN